MRRFSTSTLPRLIGTCLLAFGPAHAAGASPGHLTVHAEGPDIVLGYEASALDGLPVVGRLLPVPDGAEGLTARVSACEVPGIEGVLDLRAEDLVTLGPVMTMRGRRWMPVTLRPYAVDPETGQIVPCRSLRVSLSPRGGVPGKGPEGSTLESTAAEAIFSLIHEDGPTGYLIVTAPEYETDLDPLVEWKRRKGYEVTVATTDETGVALSEIRDFIAGAYETWEHPPLYVLLVGDVDEIPCDYSYSGDVSDHPYAAVEGDDYLPELFVGRLAVGSRADVQTIVAKTVHYERHPYTAEGSGWFTRALMVAADYGSQTPVQTSRYCAERLRAIGFTEIDSVYCDSGCPGQEPITASIDSGLTIVNYRGWARGSAGWHAPDYQTEYIEGLANGWKLPVVISNVCHTGNFGDDGVTFGETWVRAGSASEPKGAVAFIGNGDPWSYTRWNDRIAMGFYESMECFHIRRLGAILAGTKIALIDQFPSELWYDETGEQSVEFYFHIYNLQGDPELSVWTAGPRTIVVTHPDTVSVGADFVEVTVTEADGVTPVERARVGVVQGGQVLGSAHTGPAGTALVAAAPAADVDSLNITVTGTDLLPYEGLAAVVVPEAFLAYAGHDLDDSAPGNGDGILNPGETAAIAVTLANSGTEAATGVTAAVDSIWGADVVSGTLSFADITAGEEGTSLTPLSLRVGVGTANGTVVRVGLRAEFDGGTSSRTFFTVPVAAPDPVCVSAVASADSVLDPGETAELIVTLANAGSAAGSGVTAVLRSLTGSVTVSDSLATLGAFAAGDTVANASDPFEVTADPGMAVGQAAGFTVELTTAEGAVLTASFAVIVGRVDHSAPLGPDAYGYYGYDNTDEDYAARPLFDWIPCSPAYGGEGVNLNLRDNRLVAVGLPFVFTHYGQPYDSLVVSDNGWLSFDTDWYLDFNNWTLPNLHGNACQVAAFWENLNPRRRIDGAYVADGVYAWSDTARHRFVVEWSRIPYFDEIEDDNLQTFQIILYDPDHYATPTGDGEIVFQYKQIVDVDETYQRATVGIEDHTEEVGLEYAFSGIYPPGAAPLSGGLAVKFTTQPPVRVGRPREPSVVLDSRAGLATWPNPFNPSTTIRYRVTEAGPVVLDVYDVLGRQVVCLVRGHRPAGSYEARWEAAGLASGVYFCRLTAADRTETIKIMLLK